MSFEEIYSQYSKSIYRLCRAYINDDDLAKDIHQETFVTVWQKMHTFKQSSSIGTWIYRIAVNKCLRSLEIKNRHRYAGFPSDLANPTEPDRTEKIQWLYTCISELDELDRIIISLELDDLPQADIASVVGLEEGNVRVKLHRIKQRLTQKMKLYGQL